MSSLIIKKNKNIKEINLKKLNALSSKGADKDYGEKIINKKLFTFKISEKLLIKLKTRLLHIEKKTGQKLTINSYIMEAITDIIEVTQEQAIRELLEEDNVYLLQSYSKEKKHITSLYFEPVLLNKLKNLVSEISTQHSFKLGKVTKIIILALIIKLNLED